MEIRLDGFAVRGYKAFARQARVELAPLTILLGRNNAGKSSLCYAPLFFTHSLRQDAQVPFELRQNGIDFGTNLLDVCFRRQPAGLEGTLSISGDCGISELTLGGVALAEENYLQLVTKLDVEHPERPVRIDRTMSWEEAHGILADFPELAMIPDTVAILLAHRKQPERNYRYLGREPVGVGSQGEHAPHVLAHAKASGQDALLHEVNSWFNRLGVRIDVVSKDGTFDVVARSTAGEASLVDTGSGIAQVLPLVVALKVWPEKKLPQTFIVEQPELHLHPFAHAMVAELLIESLQKRKDLRLLVETHSDALILRIRREVASGRLTASDVRLYFVDERTDGPGSSVQEICLNDRGTPEWWPDGVFAESQREFYAIRRVLAKRDEEI